MGTIWEYISILIYLVGICAIVVYLFENLKSIVYITKSILEPYFQPQVPHSLAEKYGKWAVITGATDGIGKQYCKELAKQGINIILISRTEQKLIDVANEIENEFRVKTKWIVGDFSKGREIYEHIRTELSGIPVGILVNNVGKMYDYPDELGNIAEDVIWDLININVAATTIMTRILVEEMKKNRKGAIVNISSGSELQPIPYMAVYAATKRYIKSLTHALEHELAPYGITVQCVTPMFLVTKMNHYSERVLRGGFLIPDVKTYTRSVVFTLGKTNETTGYWTHALQYAAMKIAPERIRKLFAAMMSWKMKQEYLQPPATATSTATATHTKNK